MAQNKDNFTKIYLIKGWNGEPYEDSYEWIEPQVYISKDKAEEKVNQLNKEAKKRYKKNNDFYLFEYRIIEKELVY